MTYRILVFCEGSFVRKTAFMSLLEAIAYSNGFREGASEYGGGAGAYVIPCDDKEMHENEDEKEIQRAMR